MSEGVINAIHTAQRVSGVIGSFTSPRRRRRLGRQSPHNGSLRTAYYTWYDSSSSYKNSFKSCQCSDDGAGGLSKRSLGERDWNSSDDDVVLSLSFVGGGRGGETDLRTQHNGDLLPPSETRLD